MKAQRTTKIGIATLIGGALGAAVIGLAAPAVAAPNQTSDHHTNGAVDALGYTMVSDNTVDALHRD